MKLLQGVAPSIPRLSGQPLVPLSRKVRGQRSVVKVRSVLELC